MVANYSSSSIQGWPDSGTAHAMISPTVDAQKVAMGKLGYL